MAKTSVGLIAFFVVGMILSGTLNTLTTKMQFTTVSENEHGDEVPFAKPWFGTFNMLFAMALVGVVDKCVRCFRPPQLQPDSEYLPLDRAGAAGKSYLQKVLLIAVPAAFDLVATAFCCVGMLYIPASVWQMLKGGSIIFCAILSITFLKRRMFSFNWIGLFLVVLGITLVGLSSILGSQDQPSVGSASSIAFGMGLVLLGQVVQAAQVIAEEWLMKDVDLPAMQIVGWEGLWGTLMMCIIVYPLLGSIPGQNMGVVESPYDTLVQLENNRWLQGLVVLYLFSCGTFNATGIAVTGALSAVHRMMLDASRTTVIWSIGLAVHYCWDKSSPFGEAWTPFSILQLVGFVVLVSGQAVYGEVLKVPGLKYPTSVASPMSLATPGSINMSSPLPREDCNL